MNEEMRFLSHYSFLFLNKDLIKLLLKENSFFALTSMDSIL